MNTKEFNQKLYNAVYKKNIDEVNNLLNNHSFKIQSLKEKYTGYNLLHLSTFNFELFKRIFKLNPKLITLTDNKGESPLFPLIRTFKQDLSFVKPFLNKKQLDLVNTNNENILSILINKKEYKLIKDLLRKNFNLIDYNYYHLNRLNINIPKSYYNNQLKHKYKEFKTGNFSLEYIKALSDMNINSFRKNPSKKYKKYFFGLINDSTKETFPHIKLQKMIILNKFQINDDLIFNYLKKDMPYYGFLNQKEFETGVKLLTKLHQRVSINSFFNLLDDLFFTEFKNLEYLFENLAFCKIPKKIKTWEELQEKIKKSILLQRNEKYKSIDLNQGIDILNNKLINNELYIYVPQKQEDLILTSYFLNMCVGNSFHYTNKIKKFESLIIILKDIKTHNLVYCLELSTSRYFKIIQAKGNYNKDCPTDIVIKTQNVIDSIMGKYIKDD